MPSTPLAPLRLTGAKVLRDGKLLDDALSIADGRIAVNGGAPVDLSGYWLLPGIVDMHGDAFERHMAPRSGVGFDFALGLASTDADLCANGVTTAYLAQCFSWEGGKRGADWAEGLVAAVARYRPVARADFWLQLRYETHFVDGAARMLALVRSGEIDYVVFNNHLPEAIEMWRRSPSTVAAWAAQNGRSAEEHMDIVTAAAARGPEVPSSLALIAGTFRERGILFGSHDDPDRATRESFHALGAAICEFPTSRDAAERAHDLGNPVLMGAPNVVRGGSQSGNVAAEALISEGLCDVLVSDYFYPALPAAAWTLADSGVLEFAAAWAMMSEAPARVLKLSDRGKLEPGARADIVVMDPATRRIEAVFAAGRPVHMAGEAAVRIIERRTLRRLAAE